MERKVFYTHKRPFPVPAFDPFLVGVGKTRTLPTYTFGPLKKEGDSLLLIIGGRGSLHTEHAIDHFSQGDVVRLRDGERCAWWTDPHHTLEHYWLIIEGRCAPALFQALGLDPKTHVLRRDRLPPPEVSAAEALLQAFREQPPAYVWQAQALFFEICRSIALSTARESTPTPANEALESGRRLIDARFTEPITIAEVAERVALTPEHFATQFRLRYGQTPHDYLTMRRMERARLLLESGVPVREASRAVGYRDPSYFSRVFRKNAGVAPSRISRRS